MRRWEPHYLACTGIDREAKLARQKKEKSIDPFAGRDQDITVFEMEPMTAAVHLGQRGGTNGVEMLDIAQVRPL
ncbi:hypothetical protein ASD99_04705 [Mesorhizobium sp. Root695]|nr:hypothetical protein ASD99_04705 [Mesorhizobium sp. Root695]